MNGVRRVSTLIVAALMSNTALADHYRSGSWQYAKVISSEPIYETVSYSVPVEQCREETVAHHEPRARSATAPIVGAIIGGALGNAVGHKKRNKQVGAVVGAVLGGSIGADVARRRAGYGDDVYYSTREVCSVVHERHSEQRITGYLVTYRYGGETYTAELDHDPGDRLRVRVDVTPVG